MNYVKVWAGNSDCTTTTSRTCSTRRNQPEGIPRGIGCAKAGVAVTFLRGNYQVLRRGVSLLFCDTGVIFVNKPGEKGCESALGLLLSGPLCSG